MLNDTVPSAMAKTFETAKGGLADRLMKALEAAQEAGGDIRGKQSASMLIVKAQGSGKPWSDRVTDLRVDDHPEPLRELRRLLDVARSYEHANAGDLAMEKNDFERAMKEYRVAMKLAGGNMEITFWSAVTLASKGKVDFALPLFKKVFSTDKNWVEVLKRLPKTGTIISDDQAGREMLKRILTGTGQR
jgi:uncharacterized Ntn-hydrolase superfamily protein